LANYRRNEVPMLLYRNIDKSEKRDLIEFLMKAFMSKNDELIKVSGYCIAELNIIYDEFNDLMGYVGIMNEKQSKAIIEMLCLYLKKEKYRSDVENILVKFFNKDICAQYAFKQLFFRNRIDLSRSA